MTATAKGLPHIYKVAIRIEEASLFLLEMIENNIKKNSKNRDAFKLVKCESNTYLCFRLRLMITIAQTLEDKVIEDMILKRGKKILFERLTIAHQILDLNKNFSCEFEKIINPETRLPYKDD